MSQPEPERRGFFARMAQNRVAANVMMAVILGGGLFMIPRVRQEVFPEFDLDLVLVQVAYPGASPAEVEQGVVLAIEEAVRGLDGVKEVRSTATENVGVVAIELLLGANSQKALSDVTSAVGRIASFPGDIERPVVSLATLRGEAISLVIHGRTDETSLRALADRVRDNLLQDPTITTIELSGVRPLEIHVEVTEDKLRAYGMRLDEIARAIREASVEIPGGVVKTRAGEVLVRTAERRTTGAEIAEIVLRSRPDGTIVRGGDVATVRDGYSETDQLATFDGEPAVMLKVFRVGEQRPLDIAAAVIGYSKAHAKDLPPGVSFSIWNDRSEIYAQRLDLLRRNAILGLVLVMITLGLFLEVRLAFWVTMGIPTAFLGTMLLMPATSATINMISLFAFILTLGIVVDDAIVVAEAVYHQRQLGKTRLDAAIAGVSEVAVPVVFSVLTTVVAFVPLMFVPGVMGKFFFHIPVVVISVLLLSLFESLVILPAHLAHVEDRKPWGPFRGIRWVQDRFQNGLAWVIRRTYLPTVTFAARRRYLTLALGLAVLLSTVGLVVGGRIEFTFFPKIDSDIVRASLTMPFGTATAETEAVRTRLEQTATELLAEMGGGKKVRRGMFAVLGSTGTTGRGPRAGAGDAGGHLAEVAVQLVLSNERPFTARQFGERWREKVGDVAGVETLTFDYSTGGPGGQPIDFELSHRDLSVLQAAATDLAERLGHFDGVRDIDDGFSEGKVQLDFRLRPEARALGITEGEMGRQIRSAFFGAEAVRQQRGRDELRVYVRRPRDERESLATIERFLLRTPTGGEVPLSEAAEVTRGHSYTKIERVDGRRIVHVSADVAEGTNANRVVGEVRKDVVPGLKGAYPGLGVGLGGHQEAQQEALSALGASFTIALLVMFGLMAIPFKSYMQPIIIMTAIPFSFVGAIVGHLVMGFDLSLLSAMGMVALAGVAVNDAIVLVDAINNLRREGMPLLDAVTQAGARRFRAVLLTSLTTFFGLTPMILEPSVQARFLIPMALSLGVGVLFCTFTTLIIVPSLVVIYEDIRSILMRVVRFVRGEAPPPEQEAAVGGAAR